MDNFFMNIVSNSVLNTILILLIIIVITLIALKLALKNKKTKCANCKLACSNKKSFNCKNFQHNFEKHVNNNDIFKNTEVYSDGKRNK